MNEQDIFARVRLLTGDDTLRRLASCRVILFGTGGVGSWCAESLVRSGIGHLTIVDADCVNASNVNRQLMATTRTIGRPKVEVLRERLLEINPDAVIEARQEVYCAETAASFPLESYDYVIDCIDSLKDKLLLIEKATHSPAVFFSSMGAALKMDPTRIRVAEFWDVYGDPLARALRKKFHKEGREPGKKFLCVFSDELLENRGPAPDPSLEENIFHKAVTNGTLCHITAIFGHTLAGLVLQNLCSNT